VLAPIPLAAGQDGAAVVLEAQSDEASLHPELGEKVNIAGKELVWQASHALDYALDLTKHMGSQQTTRCAAYAVCYIDAAAELADLRMKVGSDDQSKVFLNGKEVYRSDKPRGCRQDDDTVPNITLHQGTNVLVFKIVNEEYFWEERLAVMLRQASLAITVALAFVGDAKPAEDGFVSLFDGKTLAGWTGACPILADH
jgi:hypothetical protein